MQTAASRIQEAYKNRPQSPVQGNPLPNENTNHYLWYPAEDIPSQEATGGYTFLLRNRVKQLIAQNMLEKHVDVPCGFIERCRVAPVLAWPVWERAMDVPMEMRGEGRGVMPSGDYEEYLYHVPAGHIFQTVYDQYRGWGVTELRALTGFDVGDFLELQIDETFFPMAKDRNKFDKIGKLLDEIPKKYEEIEARITSVAESLPDSKKRKILEDVAADMLQAVEVSRAFDIALVEEEETRQPLKYSLHGLRALSRLGRKRRDHALNEMAARQDKVFTNLPEMFKEMAGNQQPSGFSPEQFSEFASTVAEKIAATMAAQFNKQPAPQQNPQPQQGKKN